MRNLAADVRPADQLAAENSVLLDRKSERWQSSGRTHKRPTSGGKLLWRNEIGIHSINPKIQNEGY
jgi:hypothetical protein